MMSWYLSVSGLLRDQGSFENVKCLGSKFGGERVERIYT